ncbi:hypothetical protein B0H11DRAFT_2288101 [Mycena galericulata]|nr:hypothetical protein B0H11DRAFT_2288101 [Mycena galericulata]
MHLLCPSLLLLTCNNAPNAQRLRRWPHLDVRIACLWNFFWRLLTMSGCFSWCPLCSSSDSTTRTKAVTSQHASDDDGSMPTTEMYALSGGKALASTLKDLSGVIPVPLLGEFMKLAIGVIEACEEATVVEEKVTELQARVYNLTLLILDKVPAGSSANEELQSSIEKLQDILKNIIQELNGIKEQKKWLLVFFRDMNKERVDRCLNHVETAMEQFTISHQLRVEELLDKIKSKFSDVSAQLSGARAQLSDIGTTVDRIERVVKSACEPHNAPETLSRQDMPPAQRIFYGREKDVDAIVSFLSREDTSRVCITGAGGMGKTSVALAVIHNSAVKDLFPSYRFWVPCVEAKSADLLRRILYTQLRITADSYDSLDPLIKELSSSEERRVLLLDNFETPWLSGENQDKIRDILVRLTELPHIALIVTMASQFPPSDDSVEWKHRPLLPLDAVAARETFKRLYPGAANAPKLDELLTAIGHIPLAITLLAADGKHSQATPKDLLKGWKKAGTEINSTMDRRIGLSVQRVESKPEAFQLLAILSMLPAGTTGNNLRWWAPTLISHPVAVVALRTAALVEQEEGNDFGISRIFLRPTIQAYMAQQNRISMEVQQQVHEACYKFVLEHKSIPDDAKFKGDLRELADEETNIQGLLMQIGADNIPANALDALIAFALYQSWRKPSTVVALHALEIASAAQDGRRVAEAHQCLGKIFFKLDRFEEAGQHFEAARKCFKTLPGGVDRLRAGECSMKLAETWMWTRAGTGADNEIHSLVLEAQADLSHDASNRYHVAHGLRGVGHFLWWETRRDEALEMLSAAKAIFEELECPASTAECLYLMGICYARRNEYQKALVIYKEGLAAAEERGDIELILRLVERLAGSLIALSFHDKAFDHIERALTIGQALGSPLSIAQDLELLGYNCAARMDLRGAQTAYKGARAQYAGISSSTTPLGWRDEARCVANLKKLEDMSEIDENVFPELAKPDTL